MTDKPKKNNRTIIAILVVSVLPIVAAYFAFFTGIGVPDHTVNTGKLLPHPLSVKNLLSEGQSEFLLDLQQNRKWRLLIPIPDMCGTDCQQNLYTTRQVHIRLGEKSVRVERVALNIAGQAGLDYFETIKTEHPRLKLVTVTSEQWRNWLHDSGENLDAQKEHFYLLVDQEGFAMMTYTTAQHGNELLKDLKRALKYSIDFQ